jgi:8-hydroxy-5-deazaflavin:NADPH oxidoreductase
MYYANAGWLSSLRPAPLYTQSLAGRPVIKAFNNIYFKSLRANGRPKGTSDRIALPVAADPVDVRAQVLRLVDEVGFDPVDARRDRRVVAAAAGHAVLHPGRQRGELKAALAAAVRGRVPEYRKAANAAANARLFDITLESSGLTERAQRHLRGNCVQARRA